MDEVDFATRKLLVAAYMKIPVDTCYDPVTTCCCGGWTDSMGSEMEYKAAMGINWFVFGLSVSVLLFYVYQHFKATCGWEEVYVCIVELTKAILDVFVEKKNPATLYLQNGHRVLWMRYAEWLLTCPVILIHLSNLTGLGGHYNPKTMNLLVSDIGTIVFGATAAMSEGWLKIFFYCLGCVYGGYTYYNAAKVYIESYHVVPKGDCRRLLVWMAVVYYVAWTGYPILFILGPEGWGPMSYYGSTIATSILDIFSKNIWGFLGHWLRYKLREHILLHGDIRKKITLKVLGEEVTVKALVEEEDDETIKHSTSYLAGRRSMHIMREKLEEKGLAVRASLDAGEYQRQMEAAAAKNKVSPSTSSKTNVAPKSALKVTSSLESDDSSLSTETPTGTRRSRSSRSVVVPVVFAEPDV